MIQNKRGLSTIVVTLILVVLSLVAVGVVWAVINNLLKSGTSGANLNAQCLGVNLQITQANCVAGTTPATTKICDVQVMRSGTTSDALAGVKLVFRNKALGLSSPTAIDVPGDVPPIAGIRLTGKDSGIANANTIDIVEITPYFKDGSGNVQLCQQASSFNFVG